MQTVIRRLIAILLAGAPGALAGETIILAAAASTQFAMEEICAAFQEGERGRVLVKPVFGSSGKLTAQVRGGAPFDVFVSADMEYPDTLRAWGLAADRPTAYALGRLVLWTARGVDLSRGISVLAHAGAGRIALADPARAPYGREAMKALERAGLRDGIASRLVFGESISQVTQYVLTGAAGVGLSAKSVVLAPEMAGKGVWAEVDSTLYDRIPHGAVVLRHGKAGHPAASARFLAFLLSAEARASLSRHGYDLPAPRPEVTRK